MRKHRAIVATLTSIALILAPCLSFADPGNGKGQASQAQGNSGGGKHNGGKQDRGHGGPVIDRGGVFAILNGHRGYWSPASTLPPGIQKNLARGKPLPPGVAKKLDGRLLGQLPRYDGYEWMQAGVDLILVAVATGVIYEVLNDAFD